MKPYKVDNEFAEYFQLTFFLIVERLKGPKSFFHPFVNYLPSDLQTLYTYPDATFIKPESNVTLMDEIQYKDDDIFDKIK